MQAYINFDKPTPPIRSNLRPKEPKYELVVPDIDALIAVIFEKVHRNPLYYVNSLSDEARTYITRLNKFHIWEN